jgi:hypothetical protein
VGFRLTPRDDTFYDLFAQSARHLVDGAHELTTVLGASMEERVAIADRIHAIEHAADEATHELIRQVNGAFVTPFDREDIHELASQLDTCMDHMDAAADLIVLYRLDGLPQGIAEQVETLTRMADLTAESMPRLRSVRDLGDYWIEINRLENQADQVYRRLLADLFNNEQANALHVMKLKEVIDELEAAADAFEDVANRVEGIAVKGA